MKDKARCMEFLEGLAQLTRRTGVAIGGCGCCGSPDLEVVAPDEPGELNGYVAKDYDSNQFFSYIKWGHLEPGEQGIFVTGLSNSATEPSS